ncbi:hypothetical protein Ssi02_28290 [Sinosporangium siamense]|uniref:Uncharacterized protein n=1 Tax=Sinosporangium siamense TaxID=1367973 RepID=A0A919V6L3_9ACTN|nr:hypothetical protein Ssi02_28290 [Sinosporangium siamense]
MIEEAALAAAGALRHGRERQRLSTLLGEQALGRVQELILPHEIYCTVRTVKDANLGVVVPARADTLEGSSNAGREGECGRDSGLS